jgi:hypothetical protein
MIEGSWYYHRHVAAPLPTAASPNAAEFLSNEQLEAQYGFRISQIAVTLSGGSVDFQYQIVDPKKSALLLGNRNIMPVITTLDKGLKLFPTRVRARHQSGANRSYMPYRFFPNARSAVKPGTPIAVSFGDVRIGPIIAQ